MLRGSKWQEEEEELPLLVVPPDTAMRREFWGAELLRGCWCLRPGRIRGLMSRAAPVRAQWGGGAVGHA